MTKKKSDANYSGNKEFTLRTDRGRHSVYRLQYHLIITTKYRRKCITEEMFIRLEEETKRLFEIQGIELVEMNYEPDHVHILLSAPPTVCLSTVINSYKSVTSRVIRREFAEHLKRFYWKDVFWNRSYMILSSGGAPIEVIRKYIENQAGDGTKKQKAAISP